MLGACATARPPNSTPPLAICRPETPDPRAVDVTWADLTQRWPDFDGRRVRLAGWYTAEFEANTIWPSASISRDFLRPYVSDGGSLAREEYDGNPANVEGCARQDVLVEGTFSGLRGRTDWLHAGALVKWRVVSTPRELVLPTRPVRKTLPDVPDADMVRIVGRELPAGWQPEAPSRTMVDTFDIDRDEASAGTFRKMISNGGLGWLGVSLIGQDPVHDERPLVNVSAAEAEILCRSLGKRLPEEKEWVLAAYELILLEPALRANPEACVEDRLPPECAERIPVGRSLVCDRGTGLGQADERVVPATNDATGNGVLDLSGSVEEWTATPFCLSPLGCSTFHRVVRGGHTGAMSAQKRGFGEATFLGKNCMRGFRCAR